MEYTSTFAVAQEGTSDLENPALVGSLPVSFSRDDDETAFEGAIFSSSPVLDLSQRGLSHLGEFFKIPNLQQLYLQRNSLSSIPKDFFQLLPNLTWLDLRYNKIKSLPSGIGSHRHLKTLLLERNPIKVLPVELDKDLDPCDGTAHIQGQVITLKALNLRHCPLEFPPQLIVQKGLVAILTFLRICSVETAFPGDDSSHEVSGFKMSCNDLPYPMLPGMSHRGTSIEKALNILDREAAVVKEKGDSFPSMDRLDLSEFCRSSAAYNNWPSEEEIKRFWKLRQEIVENEKVEILEKKLLAVELPPNLRAALNAKEKRRWKPGATRKKSTSFKGMLPNLPSTYQNSIHIKRPEDSRMVTLQELQDKETLLDQRRRDKRALKEWREQTQLMRSRRELNKFPTPPRRMTASKIPFATDLIDYGKTPMNPLGKVKHCRERMAQRSAEMSTLPLADLEEKIRWHTQQICARNFLGTNPLQDMKIANQDLDTVKKLQEELRKLNLEMTLNKEQQFANFTGNLSLHPPASQPQNIFFNTKY